MISEARQVLDPVHKVAEKEKITSGLFGKRRETGRNQLI